MTQPSTPPVRLLTLALAADEAGSRLKSCHIRAQDSSHERLAPIRTEWTLLNGQLTPPQSPENTSTLRLPLIREVLKEFFLDRDTTSSTTLSRSSGYVVPRRQDFFLQHSRYPAREDALSLSSWGPIPLPHGNDAETRCQEPSSFSTRPGTSAPSFCSTQPWTSPLMQQAVLNPYSTTCPNKSPKAGCLPSPSGTPSPTRICHSSLASPGASDATTPAPATPREERLTYDNDEVYAMLCLRDIPILAANQPIVWELILKHFTAIFPPGKTRRCSDSSAAKCPPRYTLRTTGALQCKYYRARTEHKLGQLRKTKGAKVSRRMRKQSARLRNQTLTCPLASSDVTSSTAPPSSPPTESKGRRCSTPIKKEGSVWTIDEVLRDFISRGKVSHEVVKLCEMVGRNPNTVLRVELSK